MDNLIPMLGVLAGVCVGWKLAYSVIRVNPKETPCNDYEIKEKDVPDSLIKKIVTGEYFKKEEEPKETFNEKVDKSKRHAFYD